MSKGTRGTKKVIVEKWDLMRELKKNNIYCSKKIIKMALDYNCDNQKKFVEIAIFLQQNDVSIRHAKNLMNCGDPGKLYTDPFILNIPFMQCDKIAQKLNVFLNTRIIEFTKFYLSEASISNGHCYVDCNEYSYHLRKYFNCDIANELEILNSYADNGNEPYFIINDNKIYSKKIYDYERKIVKNLNIIKNIQLNNELMNVEYNKNNLDEKQINALELVSKNNLIILTGGPGTGKTKTIARLCNGILHSCDNIKIHISGPTGMAVSNMRDKIQEELPVDINIGDDNSFIRASTIHMYCAGNKFKENEIDIFIIDEMSMVDIEIFNSLLKELIKKIFNEKKISPIKLILVGDYEQLPSIGPGNILHDIIKSNVFPHVHLEKIFRTESTLIIQNSLKITRGEYNLDYDNDFIFIESNDIVNIRSEITKIIENNKDYQFLTPINGTNGNILGAIQLNYIWKSMHNPNSPIWDNDNNIGLNDKVMQIRNRYDLNKKNIVCNGSVGYVIGNDDYKTYVKFDGIDDIVPYERIVEIKKDEIGKISFTSNRHTKIDFGDNKIVVIPRKIGTKTNEMTCKVTHTNEFSMKILFDDGSEIETDRYNAGNQIDSDLRLAYCITIHKSQGSEYNNVVIPIHETFNIMLNKKLLYTAITRAKKKVILIGSKNALNSTILRASPERNTTIKNLLRNEK